MEYYSAIKKNEILPFEATWLDLGIIILSKSGRERQISYDITYEESKKMIQMNLFTQQKQTHRLRERTYGYRRGRLRGKDWEFGIDMYTLLYLKWITNKDLLYSTGNSAQYSVT